MTQPETESRSNRRTFLKAVGAAAVTATLAGCTAPSQSSGTTTTTETTTTTTTREPQFPIHEVLMDESELPTEPEHGVADLRDLMVVIERENESIAIVDTVNHELIGRVEDVGHAIHVVDYPNNLTEGREGAYVYTQSREGWMYKIDLWWFNRVARVRNGVDARDIAVSNDNRYVAGGFYNPKQLFVANADDMSPVKTIPTHGVNFEGEDVDSQVHALYDVAAEGLFLVALHEAGRVQLYDYKQDDIPMVADIQVGRGLHDGFFGPHGRYFYIASQDDAIMGVVDTKKRELAAKVDTSAVPHPGPGSVDADRNRAYTTHLGAPKITAWDTETFEVVKSIDVPGKGLFSRYHSGSKYIWADVMFDAAEKNSLIYTIDPETLEVVHEIDTAEWGEGRSLHPEFTRDGKHVYISLWDAGKLLVFDSNTAEHVKTIDGFTTPTGKFLGVRAEGH